MTETRILTVDQERVRDGLCKREWRIDRDSTVITDKMNQPTLAMAKGMWRVIVGPTWSTIYLRVEVEGRRHRLEQLRSIRTTDWLDIERATRSI